MRIRFWGTRGSMAKPGPTTLRYGGNTSCVEVRTVDGTLIVLDCGTGAHGLGQALLASGVHPVRGHLLITHTHWDHIQGFPFFAPLFIRGNVWDIYAPGSLGQHLEQTLSGQMEYTYFPVTLEQLDATIRYHDLIEGTFELGKVHGTARYLNHPALALGYRLEAGGVSIVYATDHEPHSRHQLGANAPEDPTTHARPVHQEERGHIAFLANADLVIHDAQYTAAEYAQKVGWGHSTVEYAVDVALAAQAKRLALFHHDPLRDDDALDRVVAMCRQRVQARGGTLEVFAAAEGMILDLPEEAVAPSLSMSSVEANVVTEASQAPASTKTILIVDDDPNIVRLVSVALRPEGYRLLSAYDGETALRMIRDERPSLVLLDRRLPARDGLEVCRILRAETDPHLCNVPVVLLTARAEVEDIEAGFAAGATDYLTKPFVLAHVRSRVRGWLLRVHPEITSSAPQIPEIP